MATTRLFRSALHRHADPTQRAIGVADLPPDSDELTELLAADPAPEVRVAAAGRCTHLGALAAAWDLETDSSVRAALASALTAVLADTSDGAAATAWFASDGCTDAIRAAVARSTHDAERRRAAIAAIREEGLLLELALTAEHADTRLAAAERVATPEGLAQLAETGKKKDRGVARLARTRINAMTDRESDAAEADAIMARLEALALEPGPILDAVIELNRRWQALKLIDDPARIARCDAARQALQARFDREHEEQRARMRFQQKLGEWLARTEHPATAEALAERRAELAALLEGGRTYGDAERAKLDEAQRRINGWTQELRALAAAEALVVEAEQLAASTSIDNAKLPDRWQALDRHIRTPALTRRFEAALIVVEQRRLAQIRAAEQETHSARQQLHNLLHTAEQALAAGQLQAAQAAAEEIRKRKPGAGTLPKPTMQRLSRVAHEVSELERWESFGQRQARVRLCERAEAAAGLTVDPSQLAVEVQNLRNEWKALDQQHAGVPRSLWERFDRACEKAYAPAARYFAEQAALRKQARQRREEFIAAVAAQAPTLLTEPRDWRAIERWLRETDRRWHEGDLGSVEPKSWKDFDARFRNALAPARDALSAARAEAKARRVALIEQATALAAKALERDAPTQVKAIQAQWQAQAKELALAQRDERALWEQFRSACDAVFKARDAKRKEADDAKSEDRRAVEQICEQLEQLAAATDKDDQHLRRSLRELQDQWRQRSRASGPVPRAIESRFASAKTAVEAALAARARSREAAVWQTLAAKEKLCEELDSALRSHSQEALADSATARWTALPALPAAWEKAMLERRDAALRALSDEGAAGVHLARIDEASEARREGLLRLEMQLGLECPLELQAQRFALQVKLLRDRFQSAAVAGANSPGERLLAWCAQPGVVDPQDRTRCDRVFSAMERAR
jgi:hypothetical protein